MRTARALIASRGKPEDTTSTSVDRIGKLTAAAVSTRILVEMALCESRGTSTPGKLDVARMMANVMLMHQLGGWSEAIRYEGKTAEVRITPLGDIQTPVEFDKNIVAPYGQALGAKRFRFGATNYEKHFQRGEVIETAEAAFDPEFWHAWIETFGFTIDQLRTFLDNVEEEGIRRSSCVYTCTLPELAELQAIGKLEHAVVHRIVLTFALVPRATWSSTPAGFVERDWYPWRYRRRLSVISRPILQVDEGHNPRYLIAPGMIRDGVSKVIDYCYNGGYEAKDFSCEGMRIWIGGAENRRGHAFNGEVAARLSELGWTTRSNIRLTEILSSKLESDYGDVDVLAWRDDRALAIECKDLELAMTVGEVARQLYEFRGQDDRRGRPDRLKRHLRRSQVLAGRSKQVARFVDRPHLSKIETVVVFSDIVPMSFSETADRLGVKFVTFQDLELLGRVAAAQ
jgi:hypothetical protein